MPATTTRPVASEATRLHAFAVASLAAAQCRRVIVGRRNGGDLTPTEWPLEARVSIDSDGVLHLHVAENAVHTREISVTMAVAVYAAVRAALEQAGVEVESAGIATEPKSTVEVKGHAAERLMKLLDAKQMAIVYETTRGLLTQPR